MTDTATKRSGCLVPEQRVFQSVGAAAFRLARRAMSGPTTKLKGPRNRKVAWPIRMVLSQMAHYLAPDDARLARSFRFPNVWRGAPHWRPVQSRTILSCRVHDQARPAIG